MRNWPPVRSNAKSAIILDNCVIRQLQCCVKGCNGGHGLPNMLMADSCLAKRPV